MTSKMQLVFFILSALFVGSQCNADYEMSYFEDEIDPKCLSRLWTMNVGPKDMKFNGRTMESFISKVERVEKLHPDWNIYDVVKAFLARFAFDDMEYGPNGPRQTPDAQGRWKIIRKLVGDDSDKRLDPEDFNDVENCTLFFMLGHKVNATFRDGFDKEDDIYIPQSPGIMPEVLKAPGKVNKLPREQGVVSIGGHATQAISLSNLLNALLTTSTGQKIYKPNELYHISKKGFPEDLVLNSLYAVTVADVLSHAITQNKGSVQGTSYFGPSGIWNSTSCPLEYKLNSEVEGNTHALLRGAIDGLLIGKAVEAMSDDYVLKDLRLSRLLRMYYSGSGIPTLETSDEPTSYCNREAVELLKDDIKESVRAFYYTYGTLTNNFVPKEYDVNKADVVWKEMMSVLRDMTNNHKTDECDRDHENEAEPICETPSNVFVVLDGSEGKTTGYFEQEQIVAHLSNKLKFGYDIGGISIFQDAKSFSSSELEEVVYNATDSTCAACQTTRIEKTRTPEGEVHVLDGINKSLQKFEQATHTLPGVPSKVVVWFHYGEVKDSGAKLTTQLNILRDGHRDTRILLVGTDKKALESLKSQQIEVVLIENGNVDNVANMLADKICKVPAIFQFHRCAEQSKSSRKEAENMYTGYVSSNHVQFWSFYPEYFLKSTTIKIQFKVEEGDIAVCDFRGTDNAASQRNKYTKKTCKATDKNKKREFVYQNPCDEKNIHNCEPINFAIIGDNTNVDIRNLKCPADDHKCRRFDQVQFKVSHDGIYCSGAEYLKSSFVALLATSLLYFFYQ